MSPMRTSPAVAGALDSCDEGRTIAHTAIGAEDEDERDDRQRLECDDERDEQRMRHCSPTRLPSITNELSGVCRQDHVTTRVAFMLG
jgi:hypothetical protein